MKFGVVEMHFWLVRVGEHMHFVGTHRYVCQNGSILATTMYSIQRALLTYHICHSRDIKRSLLLADQDLHTYLLKHHPSQPSNTNWPNQWHRSSTFLFPRHEGTGYWSYAENMLDQMASSRNRTNAASDQVNAIIAFIRESWLLVRCRWWYAGSRASRKV